MLRNRGIIPTTLGLDGKIGSTANGKWYGGVYGWSFSVEVPQTKKLAHRNNHFLGLVGFTNAYLLTGDERWLDPWRTQIDVVNAQKKVENGVPLYPHMHGDQGWYHFTPEKYQHGALEIYFHTWKPEDRARTPKHAWLDYLDGKNHGYPEDALRKDLARVRQRVEAMRKDTTTPDTRLADDPLRFNPASVDGLVYTMLAGLPPGRRGMVLHCRLRYFDPVARRAGIPPDVAALIEKLTGDSVTVSLVNTNQLEARTVILQAGGYAEHQFHSVSAGGKTTKLDGPHLTVRLEPGCGSRFVLGMKRYVNQPTLALPWVH
jgi:hypothetical protein